MTKGLVREGFALSYWVEIFSQATQDCGGRRHHLRVLVYTFAQGSEIQHIGFKLRA